MAYRKNDYAASESRTCYRQSFSVKIISQLSFRYLNKGCLNAQNIICVLQADITHFLLKVRLTNPRQKLKKKKQLWRSFSGIRVNFNLAIPPSDSPRLVKNHTLFYWNGKRLHPKRFMFECLPGCMRKAHAQGSFAQLQVRIADLYLARASVL